MSHHIEHCHKPSTFLRRKGSIWACSCGKLWRIYVNYSPSGIDSYKDWEEVKLAIAKEFK